MAEQPNASIQYADWKKYPETYKEPTHEDWLAEIAALNENAEKRIKELEADALTMALRLLGEDDSTFSPECHEVMSRWGEIAMAIVEGEK
ncbi:MAG TPA: hypothetical protein VLH56_02570 [Dissulfurispiraceae bacterium]|nr:hypothetical protein [Dissulfurispiraceae bacterium]